MKSYRIKMLAMAVAVLGFSCADDDLKPILTVDQLTVGAYPSLIALTNGEYDLNNPTTTAYIYEVEFITENGGDNVESYLIKVSLDGGTFADVRTYGQSDFSTSADGNKSISVSIPLTEVAALFGTTASLVPALSTFRFEKEITLDDGRVFTFNNSSPTVRGAGFPGDFRLDVLVTCPMTSSQFTGGYTGDYVGAPPAAPFGAPAFGLPRTVTLTTVAGSTTRRRFSAPWLGAGFVTTVTFNLVCTEAINSNSTVPGTCGGGNIVVGAGPNTVFPGFDFNDDSYFELNFIDFFADGGCGEPPSPFTAGFTKN
jgi:hypothetical protein